MLKFSYVMARLTVQNPAQHKFNIKNFLFFLRVLYIQKKTADIKIQQLKYMNNSVNKTLQVSFVSRLLFSATILLLTAVGRVANRREQPVTWRTIHVLVDKFAFYIPSFKLFSQDYYIQCIFSE